MPAQTAFASVSAAGAAGPCRAVSTTATPLTTIMPKVAITATAARVAGSGADRAERGDARGHPGQPGPDGRAAADPAGEWGEERPAEQRAHRDGGAVQAGHGGAGALLVAEQRDDRAEAVEEEAPEAQLDVGQPGGPVTGEAGHRPYATSARPVPRRR